MKPEKKSNIIRYIKSKKNDNLRVIMIKVNSFIISLKTTDEHQACILHNCCVSGLFEYLKSYLESNSRLHILHFYWFYCILVYIFKTSEIRITFIFNSTLGIQIIIALYIIYLLIYIFTQCTVQLCKNPIQKLRF